MITKNKIKLINSLKQKKYRTSENLFFCEGEKIFDLLYNSDFELIDVFATEDFIAEKQELYEKIKIIPVSDIELKKISALTTPQKVLATVKISETTIDSVDFSKGLTIILDKLQDPGNLGTIIRIADWFGIKNIVCSLDTVDVYNPKVVQATMGSLFNVNIFYTDLSSLLKKHSDLPVYGTFMDGENIYSKVLKDNGFIVMGNEANGITQETEKFVTEKLSIPTFNNTKAAESLNVAVAAAIVCSEFKRRLV